MERIQHDAAIERECLAAAAMVLAPATDFPRERALMQAGLVLLADKFGEREFDKEEAECIIAEHVKSAELRPEVARQVFDRIEASGALQKNTVNGRHTFRF
ncbi:unnamed protein product, partial [marine sediment metagenome]